MHVADFAIGPDNHKLIGDEWVSMELALFSIFANVIAPLHLPGFVVQGAYHSIAGTDDE